MSYSTQQDILDFVEDNNVKFVRFAFCDILWKDITNECPITWIIVEEQSYL